MHIVGLWFIVLPEPVKHILVAGIVGQIVKVAVWLITPSDHIGPHVNSCAAQKTSYALCDITRQHSLLKRDVSAMIGYDTR